VCRTTPPCNGILQLTQEVLHFDVIAHGALNDAVPT
jgi:hypothetical protein